MKYLVASGAGFWDEERRVWGRRDRATTYYLQNLPEPGSKNWPVPPSEEEASWVTYISGPNIRLTQWAWLEPAEQRSRQ